MKLTRILALASVSAISLGMSTANALTVTQCGPTICYEYDDAQAAVAQFGTPTMSGDSMVFLIPSFRAESDDGLSGTGGDGYVEVSAGFVIDSVYALSGEAIQLISLTEFFDYDIINGGEVTAELDLIVTDTSSLETGNDLMGFTVSGDTGGQQAMTINGSFAPDLAFTGPANDLEVIISDTLTADTDAAGENAWIQKKVTLATTIVPIPAAAWLFLSGLGCLLGFSRKLRA